MQPSSLQLTSPVFTEGQAIPEKYSCKGSNLSPPLGIVGIPAGTKSLALILHDPDAPSGDFLHWTVWNLGPDTSSISENSVPAGAIQGKIGSGSVGYYGPCPPSGTHHYIFELSALDEKLTLPEGSSRDELTSSMKGHVVAETKLTGLFSAQ